MSFDPVLARHPVINLQSGMVEKPWVRFFTLIRGTGAAGITIDGGGSVPATGSKGFVQVPYAGTIISWTLLGDVSGSAQITVKRATYFNFPTTVTITGSTPPQLASAQKASSTTLTGWTTVIASGDILEFNLDSVTTCKRLFLELQIAKA